MGQTLRATELAKFGQVIAVWAFVACTSENAAAAEGCAGYAAQAATQSGEHFALDCKNGKPEWWSVDHSYHARWCESLPDKSPLPALGTQGRADALLACKNGLVQRDDYAGRDESDPYASEGGPVKAVASGAIGLECRLKFGDFEFTSDQVSGGIHGPAPGSNGMTAICEYHHPSGSMRISSSWAMPFSEQMPPPVQVTVGCWTKGRGQQERVFRNGFETISEDYFAKAGATGAGALEAIARGPARHFAREMLIIAHLHGPRSCR